MGSLVATGGLLSCSRWAPYLRQAGSLVAAGGLLSCGMQTVSNSMQVGSSSLTRDQTWTPCIGSAESYPLRHQEVPVCPFYRKESEVRKDEVIGQDPIPWESDRIKI